jgi:hypothetical protein
MDNCVSRIRVDPRRVSSVEMKDGTSYPVGRNGWVEVTDPRYERDLTSRGQPDASETGYLPPSLGFAAVAGKTCVCGFAAWPWTTACPRCGAAL